METPDLKAIFTEALARHAGAVRSAYLDEACRGDAALRGRVEALLTAHDQAGSFLASPGTATYADPGPAIDELTRRDESNAAERAAARPGSLDGSS